MEWTVARLTCPCRCEKGKEDGHLSEPYISPAKQPITRRVFKSFLNGPPITPSIIDDANDDPAYFLFYYVCFVITVNDRMAQEDGFSFYAFSLKMQTLGKRSFHPIIYIHTK